MTNLNRRAFLAVTASGAAVRGLPVVKAAPGKRVLTLVYDKSLGMMRAIDKVVR
ncbi:MAG: Tat pathway signal protein [Paracoccaceae bacterium]